MPRNRKRNRHDILSVKSLLKACSGIIPSEEEAGDRKYTQLIRLPLERALNALNTDDGVLWSWEYCRCKKAPITSNELQNLNYRTWKKLYIRYVMNITSEEDNQYAKYADTWQAKRESIIVKRKDQRKDRARANGDSDVRKRGL